MNITAAVALGLTTSIAGAADLHVPGAYATIQLAIDAAVDGDVVLVEPGTYNEALDFLGKSITVRSIDDDPTTVTIDGTGFLNTRAVDMTSGSIGSTEAKLIGVTVRGGEAGGVSLDDASSIAHCIITENFANNGAGVHVDGGYTVSILQTLIVGNESTAAGTGLYVSGHLEMTNCVVADNVGDVAFFGFAAQVDMTNCIFWNNPASISYFGGLYNVNYSLIEGSFTGTNNLDTDPMFVDAANGDYRLAQGSPCVNAGHNGALPAGFVEDIAGEPRYLHDPHSPNTGFGSAPIIDMGAHERIPAVRYVDTNAAGVADGSSWDDAYTDLGLAIANVYNDDAVTELWVAAGTYTPDFGSGDRFSSFILRDGLTLRGGFEGVELFAGERDVDANRSVLSGEIGAPGSGDNSFHVVKAIDVDHTAVLDGFLIEYGYADGGDGLVGGGAIYMDDASPVILDTWFVQNGSVSGASAVQSIAGDPHFERCRFMQNFGGGGAIVANGGAMTLVNSVMGGNSAAQTGAALWSINASTLMLGCTVYGNTTTQPTNSSGGVHVDGGDLTLGNSIFWANDAPAGSVVTYNLFINTAASLASCTTVEGAALGWGSGAGNNGIDPEFVDLDGADDVYGTTDDDPRLSASSHAIDSGSNVIMPSEYDLDVTGAQRFNNTVGMPNSGYGTSPIVDRGAVEYDGVSCAYDSNGDGTVDVSDLLDLLGRWGVTAGSDHTHDYHTAGGDGVVDVSELLGLLGMWGPCP